MTLLTSVCLLKVRWRCMKGMLRRFIRWVFVSKGMCADVAIHYTEPPPNPHAHILLTLRSIDEHGKWMPKYVRGKGYECAPYRG